MDIPTVLSIAGSDPSGGAGIQADLKTFAALGVYGMAIPTLLTVQNTTGVARVHCPPSELLHAQISNLLEDICPKAIKIGAIGTLSNLLAICEGLQRYEGPLVIDPILISTSGTPLIEAEALSEMAKRLMPKSILITPNLDEWVMLKPQLSLPYPNTLVTGGKNRGKIRDTLHTQTETLCWEHEAVESNNTHGTGCTLSAAITAHLSKGVPLPLACEKGIQFVHQALVRAKDLKLGHGTGPLLYDDACR
jgi:hydroxymethylpyrimidine/phosphomethylpyrimidine kinase